MSTLTPEQRTAVVTEAYTWLRTPYHHAGDVKGRGVDCVKILIAVYSKVLGFPCFDPGPYPADWYMHRSEERYLTGLKQYTQEVTDREALPADIFIFKYGRCFSHAAIVVEYPRVIHAHAVDCMVSLGDVNNGPLASHERRLMEVVIDERPS
jgi:cell wall-associated NlpC family hydrolase